MLRKLLTLTVFILASSGPVILACESPPGEIPHEDPAYQPAPPDGYATVRGPAAGYQLAGVGAGGVLLGAAAVFALRKRK